MDYLRHILLMFSILFLVSCVRNDAPSANAGVDLSLAWMSTVYLDGNGSRDPNNDVITYEWRFVSIPSGSNAIILNQTSVTPHFVADKTGQYVISLKVTDGGSKSGTDTVVVNIYNTPPVANAGADQTRPWNSVVQLNGSSSTDVDGHALLYRWSIVSTPAGSIIGLSNSTAQSPTFVPDKTGIYVFSLVVTDGLVDSVQDTVTITIYNNPPSANAGADVNRPRNTLVRLDGTNSSDPEGDSLVYTWAFTSVPTGSVAVLSGGNTSRPTFIPDKLGAYILSLRVSDGMLQSNTDSVTVTVGSELIYENDFSSGAASLADFIVGQYGTATVNVDQGKLVIMPGAGYLNRGFISLKISDKSVYFSGKLADLGARIQWAFNVSNVDSLVCGSCNNLFYISLRSDSDPSSGTGFGYSFSGGGFVGDRMIFSQQASALSKFGSIYNYLIDITSGLPPEPSIGAFKIIFDPNTNLWELYYEQSTVAVDPLTITTLVGTATNSAFKGENLPYLILGSENGTKATFDNLSVRLLY